MNRKLMVLGASILQLPAIIKAKEMGIDVIAVDYDSNAIGFDFADTKLVISTLDSEAVLKAAEIYKPDGIMTLASDRPMKTVALVGEKLSLNTINLDTALNTTNKDLMRIILDKNNVSIPKYFICTSLEQAINKIDCFTTKVIVKPANNSGSRGVSLISNKEELEKAFNYAQSFSNNEKVLLEEYMEGPEVSVETIAMDGKVEIIAITDKVTTGSPHFVELGHSIPTMLPIKMQNEIKKLVKKANEVLGINIGPSHTEVIITNDGPKIVEVGARLGGDNITTHLVPLATGFDMVEACIKLAMGEKVEKNDLQNNAAAIRYINVPEGVITKINDPKTLELENGIIEINILKKIGDNVDIISSSNDRIGYVIAKSEKSSDAIQHCEKVIKLLNIKTKGIKGQ